MDYEKSKELDNHPLVKSLWQRWNQTMEMFNGMAGQARYYEKDGSKFYISTYGLDAVGWCIEEVKNWLANQENAE
jgi:hypothetical protein